jgi:hypothetical protein
MSHQVKPVETLPNLYGSMYIAIRVGALLFFRKKHKKEGNFFAGQGGSCGLVG